eukprot:comp12047_c0_seq1/m.6753 comp12047_c0_seq1/g.6753  ORF comp12047_c0_seq1/g.6753 comp12047_c0_seq1/m.6753 type:complete len:334 (-) comp12047_c0_seq1:400-1401(-)
MCSIMNSFLPCMFGEPTPSITPEVVKYVANHMGMPKAILPPTTQKSTTQTRNTEIQVPRTAFPYETDKTHIATGATAHVDLGHNIYTGEQVALKRVRKTTKNVDFLIKEELIHRKLSSVPHPNIAFLFDVDATKANEVTFVIEYAEGGDLLDHIPPNKGLPIDEAVSFAHQLLSAVAHMHSLGYAHRDIKSENCVLNKDRTVLKLIDFGYAANLSDKCAQTKKSGTVPYIAPEVFLNVCTDLASADVFSAGIVLFTLITGRFPWSKASYEDSEFLMFSRGMHSPAEEKRWDALPYAVRELLYKMLHPDPTKRCGAQEASDALAKVMAGSAPAA